MKPSIKDLNAVLTYLLEGMYDAEKQIQEAIPFWLRRAASSTLKSQIKKYRETSRDKRTKLKRIFAYLLAGPFQRKNTVVREFVKDLSNVSGLIKARQLGDVLFIASMQSLIHYKESEYITARDLAIQLELQTVSDLLSEIVEWETETGRMLARIALTEVNQQVMEVEILN